MQNIKTYSDNAISILIGDRERILKSILRQLFEAIYKEIKDKCIIGEYEKKDINEFLNWPDDYDLNSTARYFVWSFFDHKIVNKIIKTNRKFSLRDLNSIVNKPQFKNYPEDKRRLVAQLECSKKLKFSIRQISEVGSICEEIIRIRNLSAHNNGLENSAQALILMSNISRLLSLIPNQIRESTSGFNNFENFVNHDFLDSILSVIRPDIEDSIEEAKIQSENLAEESGDVFNEMLLNKVETMSNQLKNLQEINNTLSNNEATLKDILSLVYSPRPVIERQWSFDNERRKDEDLDKDRIERDLSIELEEDSFDGSSKDKQSRKEFYDSLMEFRVKIKKEMNQEHSSFRNWHNLLQSNLVNTMIDNKITTLDILKADKTFQHYYDSKQMYGKLLAQYNVNDKKRAAVEYFDIQLERYWPTIEEMLKNYFDE